MRFLAEEAAVVIGLHGIKAGIRAVGRRSGAKGARTQEALLSWPNVRAARLVIFCPENYGRKTDCREVWTSPATATLRYNRIGEFIQIENPIVPAPKAAAARAAAAALDLFYPIEPSFAVSWRAVGRYIGTPH